MARPKGRPNQGKTDTIRARTLKVYLPSEKLVNDWKSDAKESSLSLSQFILEAVERQRAHGTGPYLPKLELEQNFRDVQDELTQMKSKYEILETAYKKRDEDANKLSALLEKQKNTPENLEVLRKMIEWFKTMPDRNIDPEPLIDRLGIDSKDEQGLTQIREALSYLRNIGLVKTHMFYWEWLGEQETDPEEEDDS